MSESDPALIGRTIASKYVVEKFLGGGAMGAVYKARQAGLDKDVAVKVMHRSVAVDPSFVMRFRREAKAASRIDHPNAMRVMDFGEEPDGLLYIAMELLDGRDLHRVIHEDWPLSIARVATILAQALSAVAAAHDMGVIHRDLKPENIMILRGKDAEGNATDSLVKVCDFGIAKITEKDDEPPPAPDPAAAGQQPAHASRKLTTEGLVVGTPEYMSPEQARGEKLDARSDLYAMGIILYQLLTGRTPFTGDTALSIVLKHITDTPEPPSKVWANVHRGLEAVCLKAIAKPRDARFQSAREMREAIRAAVATPGTSDAIASAPTEAISARDVAAGAAAIATAPTIARAVGHSSVTPLGTAAAPPAKERKRFGAIPIAAILGIGAIAAGAGFFWRFGQAGGLGERMHGRFSTTPSTTATNAPSAVPERAESEPSARTASGAPAPASVALAEPLPDDKAPRKPRALAPPKANGPNASRGETLAAAPPGPDRTPGELLPVAPEPAPQPPEAAPAAVAPATPSPPPAPAFDPATCRATVGAVATNGGAAAKDITVSTQAAWTACARRGFKEKPAGPVAARVTIRFGDNRAYHGATCAGCPGAVASCIEQSTRSNVSVSFRGGDVTGEPEFYVPVTFACD